MTIIARSLIAALSCAAVSATALQQSPRPGHGGRRPPRPPIETVLDANADNVIDAEEIAAAAVVLETLDIDRDGRLSIDECLPPRPEGVDRPRPGGESEQGMRHPPLPPVLRVIDTDEDGYIAAGEISAAAQALLTLDDDGDGRLTPEEYRPKRRQGRQPSPGRR